VNVWVCGCGPHIVGVGEAVTGLKHSGALHLVSTAARGRQPMMLQSESTSPQIQRAFPDPSTHGWTGQSTAARCSWWDCGSSSSSSSSSSNTR
jgi:hypothetical protein